ncbi:hypothetical protein Fuma_02368 [Fuerstiella marisgermanici]|uniref:Uncharacterized protein n=1 Tax=Fuerstiella marisgermanici TaxID=1891926 RepID=A0A1P8WFD1_9PLAN|nr:hypothetical protein Fuma_02368 [Fuerstiella marisgermanici]
MIYRISGHFRSHGGARTRLDQFGCGKNQIDMTTCGGTLGCQPHCGALHCNRRGQLDISPAIARRAIMWPENALRQGKRPRLQLNNSGALEHRLEGSVSRLTG